MHMDVGWIAHKTLWFRIILILNCSNDGVLQSEKLFFGLYSSPNILKKNNVSLTGPVSVLRVGVPIILPEDGNRLSFRNVVSFYKH
jgi:hypothetical protein